MLWSSFYALPKCEGGARRASLFAFARAGKREPQHGHAQLRILAQVIIRSFSLIVQYMSRVFSTVINVIHDALTVIKVKCGVHCIGKALEETIIVIN